MIVTLSVPSPGLTAVNVGGVLSTLNVVLGPAEEAVFPASSEAVLAASEMERVPSPVMLPRVTVRVALPEPETVLLPAEALSVLVTVMLSLARTTLFAPP